MLQTKVNNPSSEFQNLTPSVNTTTSTTMQVVDTMITIDVKKDAQNNCKEETFYNFDDACFIYKQTIM